MFLPKRLAPLLGIAAFTVTFLYLSLTSRTASWQSVSQVIGLGDMEQGGGGGSTQPGGWDPKPSFIRGQAKPLGYKYTRNLVMPYMSDEDLQWILEPSEEELNIKRVFYAADNMSAPLHPPKNKGHEVMTYLTYIIDYYDDLPDVSIFIHAHQLAWHNNELLNSDALEMIKRLSSERVQREGYMNLRCHWNPGCPNWMHPGVVEQDGEKQEEILMASCWSELFPHEPVPNLLAQPCCAQFALSRDRIRAIPLKKYHFYRNWLLRTSLPDYLSGRIWEYLWHVVFTGQSSFCPSQHTCYCDGYGICFEGERDFDKWFEIKFNRDELQRQLEDWKAKAAVIEEYKTKDIRLDETMELEVPEMGKDDHLTKEIQGMNDEMNRIRDRAIARGTHADIRASESGREWHPGDGF